MLSAVTETVKPARVKGAPASWNLLQEQGRHAAARRYIVSATR